MFDALIESRRRPAVRASAGSLLVHSAVVFAAVTWTARSPAIRREPVAEGPVVILPPSPAPPGARPIDLPPDLEIRDVIVPNETDVAPGPIATLPSDAATLRPLAGGGSGPTADIAPAISGPLTALETDEPPELLTAGAPRYPELLRMAGVTGRVLVEAVVDTLGRAERGSLRIVQSAHPGFNDAAVAYVTGALFRPGRVLGRAVRVQVSVPIDFQITR